MEKLHLLEISEIERETQNSVLIRFKVPETLSKTFQFKAGQYVTLEKSIDQEAVRRSYSICASPEEGLQVGIKKIPDGVFSSYANDTLKAGDFLHVSIPEGRFTYQNKTSPEKIVAFAAGSGITPVMSILKRVLAADPKNKFHLIYGNKTPEDTMFYDTLKTLEKQYKGRLSITWVFSRSNTSGSFFGRIDKAIIKNYLKNEQETIGAYYLCGPEAMIQTISTTLTESGVEATSILFELFYSAASSEVISGDKNELTIVCDDVTHTLENKEGKTILEAAIQEKIDVPYSCQGGVCSSCIARVVDGSARMESNQILTDEEVEEGLILSCQAIATSPSITVNFDDV